MRRVVITGLGILSPIGNNTDEIRESFYNRRSGVVYMPEWESLGGLKSKVAGTVKNFNEENQTSALIVEQKWSKANPYSSTKIKES